MPEKFHSELCAALGLGLQPASFAWQEPTASGASASSASAAGPAGDIAASSAATVSRHTQLRGVERAESAAAGEESAAAGVHPVAHPGNDRSRSSTQRLALLLQELRQLRGETRQLLSARQRAWRESHVVPKWEELRMQESKVDVGRTSSEMSGRSGMPTFQDIVDALQHLSEKYEQEVQELRSTVTKLTTENRKLMRKSADSDGSTSIATTFGSSNPSTQDTNSPKPKLTSALIVEEPDRSEGEDSAESDPFVNAEVLEEITHLEYEARRKIAGGGLAMANASTMNHYQMKDFWRDEKKSRSGALSIPPPSSTSTLPTRLTTVTAAALGLSELYHSQVSRFIARPGDRKRLVWDLCGLLFIVYDCIAIPLNVFDPPVTMFSMTADWVTLAFWTLNICATLTTGFVQEGVEVLAPRQILKNYLKSWCIIDILTLGPDWTLEIVAHTSQEGEQRGIEATMSSPVRNLGDVGKML
ncbi:unnamed protein product [Effrenium voratum]|uniref:Ion transport domain-containing protein n=1 Tax=Effrenium voratum TaxID=2562239 RepID=A0AA36NLI2_9DINO|nr:unnamed protein product [Effrenium voratum]